MEVAMKSATPTIGNRDFNYSWNAKLSNQHRINKARQKAGNKVYDNKPIEVKRDAQGVIDYDYYAHEASGLRADAFRDIYTSIAQWFIQAGKDFKG